MLMTRASVWLLNPPPTRRKHARMRDGGCMHCAVVRPNKPLYETPCPYAYRRTEAIASSCDGLNSRESIGIAIKYRTQLVESHQP